MNQAANNFKSVKKPSEFLGLWLKYPLLNRDNQKILERYYKSYIGRFDSNIKKNYDDRLSDILELIKEKNREIRILDIGSGCGTEAIFFSMLGCEVLGIDLDEKRTNAARERKKVVEKSLERTLNCKFDVGSIFDMPPQKFDIIWMMETFHHIEPREKFVSLLPQFLNDGGCLIILESNASNPLIQLLMFKTRGFSTKKTKRDADGTVHQYGRERIIRGKTLKKILEKSGICCQNIRYFRILNFQNPFLTTIGRTFPRLMKPLFVHYNFIGAKKKTK